jgi:hypothetical protein
MIDCSDRERTLSPKFPQNSIKNGRSGNSDNSASDSYYSRQMFMPQKNIFILDDKLSVALTTAIENEF